MPSEVQVCLMKSGVLFLNALAAVFTVEVFPSPRPPSHPSSPWRNSPPRVTRCLLNCTFHKSKINTGCKSRGNTHRLSHFFFFFFFVQEQKTEPNCRIQSCVLESV